MLAPLPPSPFGVTAGAFGAFGSATVPPSEGLTALQEAHRTRGSLAGAIFHSDHGSRQYTSKDFAKLCKDLGVTQSMGAVGTSADNSMAEAFNATLKRELLAGATVWPDAATCRRAVFRWATRCNTRRRHSYCRNLSPNAYENLTAATPTQAA